MASRICKHSSFLDSLTSLDHPNYSSNHNYSDVNSRVINKQAKKWATVGEEIQYVCEDITVSLIRTEHFCLHNRRMALSQSIYWQNIILWNRNLIRKRLSFLRSQLNALRMELHSIGVCYCLLHLAHFQLTKLHFGKSDHQSLKRQGQPLQRIRSPVSSTAPYYFQSYGLHTQSLQLLKCT